MEEWTGVAMDTKLKRDWRGGEMKKGEKKGVKKRDGVWEKVDWEG